MGLQAFDFEKQFFRGESRSKKLSQLALGFVQRMLDAEVSLFAHPMAGKWLLLQSWSLGKLFGSPSHLLPDFYG